MKILRKKYLLSFFIMILSLAAFIACTKDKNNNNNSGLTNQDQNFASGASASNAAEIQFGQLAEKMSTNDSVKVFARMMVTDHTAAQKSLDSITKNLNIVRSDSMNAAHKTLYNTLSKMTAASFDTAYIRSQVQDHTKAQTLMQGEISTGKESTLINYANKNTPVIKKHLNYATRLLNYLKNNGNNTPPNPPNPGY